MQKEDVYICIKSKNKLKLVIRMLVCLGFFLRV